MKRYARLAIVGAGYMGGGIAQTLAQSGVHCTLLDAVDGAAGARRDQIVASIPQLVADGFLDDAAAARKGSGLQA